MPTSVAREIYCTLTTIQDEAVWCVITDLFMLFLKPLSHWMQVNLQDKLQVFLTVTFLFTKYVCVTFTTQQKILIYDVSTMYVTAIMQLTKTLWKRQFCHYVYWHARLALSGTRLYVNLCIFVFCQRIFLLVTGYLHPVGQRLKVPFWA